MVLKQCPYENTKKCLEVNCPNQNYCNMGSMFRKLDKVGSINPLKR